MEDIERVEKVINDSHLAHEIGQRLDDEENAQEAARGRKIKSLSPGPAEERLIKVTSMAHQAHLIGQRLDEEEDTIRATVNRRKNR